jgi:flagellar hook-basal body complex protein FliE
MAITPLITSLPSFTPSPATTGKAGTTGSGAEGFASSLGRLVDSVESTGTDANAAIGRMLDGSGDVHEAMISLQRADMTLQLTVQVRNKLVNAYQEIMRMPI